jgi:hypothetical protein
MDEPIFLTGFIQQFIKINPSLNKANLLGLALLLVFSFISTNQSFLNKILASPTFALLRWASKPRDHPYALRLHFALLHCTQGTQGMARENKSPSANPSGNGQSSRTLGCRRSCWQCYCRSSRIGSTLYSTPCYSNRRRKSRHLRGCHYCRSGSPPRAI